MAADTTFTKVISLMAYQTSLNSVAGDYYLRVKTMPNTLGIEELSTEIASRLNVSKPLVQSVLETEQDVVMDAVGSGYIVNNGYCIIQPCCQGVLQKSDLAKAVVGDNIRVYAQCQATQPFLNMLKGCDVELFKQPAVVGPWLTDAYGQTHDENGTVVRIPPERGKNIVLTGTNLKVVGTDPSIGVKFTPASGGTGAVSIPLADITINQPQKLVFVLPQGVADGRWNVTVTTQYGSGGKVIKSVRSSSLPEPLQVGEPDDGGGDGPVVQ